MTTVPVVPFAVRRSSDDCSIEKEGFDQGRLVQTVAVELVGRNAMLDGDYDQGRLLRILRVHVDVLGMQMCD